MDTKTENGCCSNVSLRERMAQWWSNVAGRLSRAAEVRGLDPEVAAGVSRDLGTSPGERVMRPEFGCRIHELVFAPNNPETVGLARRHVEEALGMWEPRIEVEEVEVSEDFEELDRGRLNIRVTYTVRGTKDSRSLVYPFYLIEHE